MTSSTSSIVIASSFPSLSSDTQISTIDMQEKIHQLNRIIAELKAAHRSMFHMLNMTALLNTKTITTKLENLKSKNLSLSKRLKLEEEAHRSTQARNVTIIGRLQENIYDLTDQLAIERETRQKEIGEAHRENVHLRAQLDRTNLESDYFEKQIDGLESQITYKDDIIRVLQETLIANKANTNLSSNSCLPNNTNIHSTVTGPSITRRKSF